MTVIPFSEQKLRRLSRCALFSIGVVASASAAFWVLKHIAIALAAVPGAGALLLPLLLFLGITALAYGSHNV